MKPRERGVVLTITVVLVALMAILAGAVLALAANQKRAVDGVSGRFTKAYFRAQAGLVEARWRIRTNTVAGITGAGGANFSDEAYDPDPYYIDLETDAVHTARIDADDVKIDIGPVSAVTRVRPIDVTGFE